MFSSIQWGFIGMKVCVCMCWGHSQSLRLWHVDVYWAARYALSPSPRSPILLSVCLSVCLSVSPSFYLYLSLPPFPLSLCFTFIGVQFVLGLLAPPGDLWFMGTSVSCNKAVSNEAREGDLCVYMCVLRVCFQTCIFAHACSVTKVTRACACELNGKQSMMSPKVLETCMYCMCEKAERERERERERKDIQTDGKKQNKKQETKQWVFEETKGICCRKLELFDKGTRPNAAPQTNVGHIFHWEQGGHQEDQLHFQLSG